MSLHKTRRHPGPDVPGCFGCHAASLHIAHSSEWRTAVTKEAALSKDLDAYARMRSEGLKPDAVKGAAQVEANATHRLDVEMASSPFVKRMNDRQKDQFTAAIKDHT